MKFKIVILLLCSVIILSCKKDIVAPQEQIVTGRRDYTWKVDTIHIDPFQHLDRIWGNSPSDVWAVGTTGIWHFNGSNWTTTGQLAGANLSSVFGFSSSDVWIGTSPGGPIYHYEGANWSLFGDFHLSGYSLTYISDIWGDSPQNVFAVGGVGNPNTSGKAVILKYDGTKWSFLDIPNITASFFKIVKSSNETGKYYLSGETVLYDTTTNPVTITGFIEKLYEFDGTNNVREIFSSKSEQRTAYEVDGRVYFTAGVKNTIWKYSGTDFSVWYSNPDYTIGALFGRNEKDIFAWVAYHGNYQKCILGHYNGSDIQSLYEADTFYDCAVFQSDVFLIIDGKTRGVAHGTLAKTK
ncbi:MAG: hypothetical protein ABSD46_02335 [Bacteroidota bacterium]